MREQVDLQRLVEEYGLNAQRPCAGRAALAAQIQTIFVADRGVYGSPRVHATLRRQVNTLLSSR
ncbi:MAG: IS3 family transposase [Ktedonobacterales bacterium]